MFKGNKKYFLLLGGAFLLAVFLETQKRTPIDWSWSFSKDSKKPFGSYLVHENLDVLFPGKKIRTKQRPLYNALEDTQGTDQAVNCIFISRNFAPSKTDTRTLLEFTARGNDVFIAANVFGGFFADTLDIGTRGGMLMAFEDSGDSTQVKGDSIGVFLRDPNSGEEKAYYYAKGVPRYYFTNTAGSESRVLGRDGRKNPNLLMVPHGKGRVYLSSLPQAFTNYYTAHPDNHEYVFKTLSFLPVRPTIWDEFYKPGKKDTGSPLGFLFAQPSLKTSMLLLLGFVLLFLVFGAKREQRPIAVLEPPLNSSLGFVKAVAAIYYRQGDHSRMARKRIRFFIDHIRMVFGVDPDKGKDDRADRLARRSGVPVDQVQRTLRVVDEIRSRSELREKDLLYLDRTLFEFHQKSKR